MAITKAQIEQLQRPLTSEEVEWRVSSTSQAMKSTSTRVIPYITARAVQSRLRELGLENFQTKYSIIPKSQMSEGGMICSVGLRFDEWVWYSECCPEADTEPIKSSASGSLKRVSNVLGISEELYRYPIVHINEPSLKEIPSYAYAQLEQLVNDFNEGKITDKFYTIRDYQTKREQPKPTVTTTPSKPLFNK